MLAALPRFHGKKAIEALFLPYVDQSWIDKYWLVWLAGETQPPMCMQTGLSAQRMGEICLNLREVKAAACHAAVVAIFNNIREFEGTWCNAGSHKAAYLGLPADVLQLLGIAHGDHLAGVEVVHPGYFTDGAVFSEACFRAYMAFPERGVE